MRKVLTTVIVLFVTFCASVDAQSSGNNNLLRSDLVAPDRENIYVHHNASLFFTGEYLYYKVYAINGTKRTLSRLSKIAYVELIGEDEKSVFKHKIALNLSQGQGDFFIPNSVPSGNYKLIAYTQRMKNIGTASFFQADISIVNPYRGNQSSITNTEMDDGAVSENSLPAIQTKLDDYSEFKLLLPERKVKKRTEVELTLKNFIRENGFGHYSLSVRKIDAIPGFPRDNSVNFEAKLRTNAGKVTSGGVKYPSESKGSIISGKVFAKEANLPAKDQNVALSISGKNFFFKVLTTNARGEFSFSLDPYWNMDTATIQVVSDTPENYKIELNTSDLIDYGGISFSSFRITPSMEDAIVERSIYNQIENAYFSIKPDTIKAVSPEKPFIYYEKKLRYNLDDYTRFETMEEVFREIVKLVWTAKDANGNDIIKVFKNEFSAPTEDPPLLFIDGAFVQDPGDLLAYNALKVQNITVVRNQYQFGNKDYQGVILIETISGEYENQKSGDFVTDLVLFKPEQIKNYYHQKYDETNTLATSRIPDFRSQLLWEPSIDLSSSEMNFKFYTSDNVGDYEISLEGFTKNGKPVSLSEIITVED